MSYTKKWIKAFNFYKPINSTFRYIKYLKDWKKYSELEQSKNNSILDTYPILFDNSKMSPFDPHYTYQAAWAVKNIKNSGIQTHVDVGSQVLFVAMLSSLLPVTFVDIRPIKTNIPSIRSVSGNVLNLPFASNSIKSISSLHVLEHIGLGRYGDELNPLGTVEASKELIRILEPNGDLYLSLPVGLPRTCFNAHRIHSFEQIERYFSPLRLIDFSAVNDAGEYCPSCSPELIKNESFGCGMFWFKK